MIFDRDITSGVYQCAPFSTALAPSTTSEDHVITDEYDATNKRTYQQIERIGLAELKIVGIMQQLVWTKGHDPSQLELIITASSGTTVSVKLWDTAGTLIVSSTFVGTGETWATKTYTLTTGVWAQGQPVLLEILYNITTEEWGRLARIALT